MTIGGKHDVQRSPHEQLAVVFAAVSAALLAMFLWEYHDWLLVPMWVVVTAAVGVPIVGALFGWDQGRRYRRGYQRFGATVGFCGACVVVLVVGGVTMVTAAFMYF
ncbi:hypothetical protein Aph01nite_75550 [Acrocarpospora phusangensis]|uniref:Uncharacterized protein n=1 Tax=Acrocarpospora phusangensis TaxID=1070424 RepID=A0A919QN03_9ACTN|nr:hypothetical protein [Acrocarpospora phusangensis]GIH29245.1 hypothetical protein Aph01nite_75550 [Acrocarpospora phusangensis]